MICGPHLTMDPGSLSRALKYGRYCLPSLKTLGMAADLECLRVQAHQILRFIRDASRADAF